MTAVTNLENALFRKYNRSNILSNHFLEMFSSNIRKRSLNAITLDWLKGKVAATPGYAMKLIRMILNVPEDVREPRVI